LAYLSGKDYSSTMIKCDGNDFFWQGNKSYPINAHDELPLKLGLTLCEKLSHYHPLFKSEELSLLDNDEVVPSIFGGETFKNLEEVLFFPGSFSPWHKGHSTCLKNAPDMPTVVIPDHNPWKEIRDTSPWQEVQAIWRDVLSMEKKSPVSLYLGFLSQQKKNPTVTWLPQVPVEKKWLLMGEDSFLNIHQWQNIEVLLNSLSGLVVCPRGQKQEEISRQREFIQRRLSGHSLDIKFLPPHPYEHLSSSTLRKRL